MFCPALTATTAMMKIASASTIFLRRLHPNSSQSSERTMMKMASPSTMFLLLLCCSVFIPTASQSDCDMYTAAGRDFVVPLNSQTKDPLRLTWSRDDSIIFRRRRNDVLTGKADDVDENGSLRLKNLTVSQSGTYKPEVVSKTGKVEQNLKTMRLCVIAPVPKPEVSVMCEGSEVTFTCTVPEKDLPQKKDMTVAWYQNDKVIDEMKDWRVTYKVETVEKEDFSCNISNLVSYAVSDPVQQTCYKHIVIVNEDNFGDYIELFYGAVTEDPDRDNTEELLGEGNGISSSIWVFVSSGVGIVLALWC